MTHSRFEQARIQQLTGLYSPDAPPRLPLDFGDYLSLLWRIDRHADQPGRVRYYRRAAAALAGALAVPAPVLRLVEPAPPGEVCRALANVPYRSGERLIDAQDRKAAISQLIHIRDDTLRIGTYQEGWTSSYPGSGILHTELRERVFAVLFTALQGQYSNFGRLLLVTDIVLADLLVGMDTAPEFPLTQLIDEFDYPDPADPRVKKEFMGGR
ncbi:MAG: hypothetical protein SF162_20305 [bacterium]|nr:hypothetical protein [bacterium]